PFPALSLQSAQPGGQAACRSRLRRNADRMLVGRGLSTAFKPRRLNCPRWLFFVDVIQDGQHLLSHRIAGGAARLVARSRPFAAIAAIAGTARGGGHASEIGPGGRAATSPASRLGG